MSGVRVLVGTRKGAFILTGDGKRKQWKGSGPHLAGVEDAGLFRSSDGGKTWQELPGLRGHGTGPKWQPGAGGMCLHTVLLDPKNAKRMYVAISAAGAFRSDDGGASWKPINQGLHSQYIPDPKAEVGPCVHRIALHR